MPTRPVPDSVRWALVGGFFVEFGLVLTGVWPDWAGCPALVALFVGAWWINAHDARLSATMKPDTREPTPEETAAREARRQVLLERQAHDRAEHDRVEGVLKTIAEREGVAYAYVAPISASYVDVLHATYRLAAPLPVTAADLAALNGPLTRFETATGPTGVVALVFLTAQDPSGFGIRVETPRP